MPVVRPRKPGQIPPFSDGSVKSDPEYQTCLLHLCFYPPWNNRFGHISSHHRICFAKNRQKKVHHIPPTGILFYLSVGTRQRIPYTYLLRPENSLRIVSLFCPDGTERAPGHIYNAASAMTGMHCLRKFLRSLLEPYIPPNPSR